MEEFLLGALFPGEELHVVDQQHVDAAVALAQVGHLVVPDGVDDLVRKLLRRDIGDPEIGPLCNMVPDRVEKVGFT